MALFHIYVGYGKSPSSCDQLMPVEHATSPGARMLPEPDPDPEPVQQTQAGCLPRQAGPLPQGRPPSE